MAKLKTIAKGLKFVANKIAPEAATVASEGAALSTEAAELASRGVTSAGLNLAAAEAGKTAKFLGATVAGTIIASQLPISEVITEQFGGGKEAREAAAEQEGAVAGAKDIELKRRRKEELRVQKIKSADRKIALGREDLENALAVAEFKRKSRESADARETLPPELRFNRELAAEIATRGVPGGRPPPAPSNIDISVGGPIRDLSDGHPAVDKFARGSPTNMFSLLGVVS